MQESFWTLRFVAILNIDWGTFFRHQNEEFLSQRYGYEKLDVEDLLSIALLKAEAKPM